MTETIEITKPDDFHLHVRDGDMLKSVIPYSIRCFQRALIMPNLVPPVTTLSMALEYKSRILSSSGESTFEPLMSLYLTMNTSPEDIRQAYDEGSVKAVKFYPMGATTHSDAGVPENALKNLYPTLQEMAKLGMPLLVHGETTDSNIDVFYREKEFIDRVLRPLIIDIPQLKVVMEHVTTEEGVQFVESCGPNVAATITVQHLLLNRNAIFSYQGKNGLRPHHYCLPVLKSERHRKALVRAATSGSPKFFAGTDSAPHVQTKKEMDCGCAGCFTSPAAIELYAELFESEGCLDKFEGFVSHHGADFYGLPRNTDKIVLQKNSWTMPKAIKVINSEDVIIPLRAGETVLWSIVN